jgi:hypothetical protein
VFTITDVSHRAKLFIPTMLSVKTASLVALAVAFFACAPPQRARQQPAAEYDQQTGKLQRLAFDSDDDGRNDAAGILDGTRVRHIEIDTTGNGAIDRWDFYDAGGRVVRVGMARRDDGVMDAVAVMGPDQQPVRVEVSTRRDGTFDRFEFYQAGRLARAEEDTDGDGRVDKWESYRGNPRSGPGEPPVIISAVAFDDADAGRPTRRLVYGPDGQVVRVELDETGDGTFAESPSTPR